MYLLKDDEFIIFMAHNFTRLVDSGDNYHVHTLEERIRMREAGIQTSHEQPAWSIIEPSKGEYNFSYLDGIINLNTNAGMKSLIQLSGWRNPTWMPNEWFLKTIEGKVERETLSFWNEEAQEHSDNFYRNMIKEYKDNPNVQFFFGEYQGGEGAMPPTWCIFDEFAVQNYKDVYGTNAVITPYSPETMDWLGKSIIKHFVRKAEIFYDAYKEVWNAQQYLMDTWNKSFGNFVHAETLQTFRALWPDANIVLLQYTYFDSSHDENNVRFVDMLKETTGCEVIAEAMFASGLPTTTPKSIIKGFRGQILHPTKESFSGEGLTDEAINNIKNSHNLWLESRKV